MKHGRIAAALAALLLGGGALRGDEQSDMRALVEKAITAHGGAEALGKSTAGTMKATGKYYGMGEGIPYTLTQYYQGLDRTRVEIDIDVMGKTFRFLQVLNGDKAWNSFDNNVTEYPKESVAILRQERYQGDLTRLVVLRDKAFKLSSLGEAKVEGRTVIGMHVERAGHGDVNLFFDKENGLLLKTEARGRDPAAPDTEFTGETFYGDYKKVGGVMLPHKFTFKHDGKLFVEGEMTEATTVPRHDDSLFAKP